MSEIIIIGTNHHDKKGKDRVIKFLTWLKPDIVTVEANESAQSYLKSIEFIQVVRDIGDKFLQRDFSKQDIENFYIFRERTQTHFEGQGAKEYCAINNIPCYFIDLWDDVERKIVVDSTVNMGSLNLSEIRDKFDSDKYQETIEREYFLIESAIAYGEDVVWYNDPDVGRRDVHMAELIKKLAKENPQAKIVHIGGSRHMFRDSRTLFSLLVSYNPKRYLLNSIDRGKPMEINFYGCSCDF